MKGRKIAIPKFDPSIYKSFQEEINLSEWLDFSKAHQEKLEKVESFLKERTSEVQRNRDSQRTYYSEYTAGQIRKIEGEINQLEEQKRQLLNPTPELKIEIVQKYFSKKLNEVLQKRLLEMVGPNGEALQRKSETGNGGALSDIRCEKTNFKMDDQYHINIAITLQGYKVLNQKKLSGLLAKHGSNIGCVTGWIREHWNQVENPQAECKEEMKGEQNPTEFKTADIKSGPVVDIKTKVLDRLEQERKNFCTRRKQSVDTPDKSITDDLRYITLTGLIIAINKIENNGNEEAYRKKLLREIDDRLNDRSLEKYRGFWATLGRGLLNIVCSPVTGSISLYKWENHFLSRRGKLYDAAAELKMELRNTKKPGSSS